MIDVSRLQKVLFPILFVVFFLCLHFLVRIGVMISLPEALCNPAGPFGIIIPEWLILVLTFFILCFFCFLLVKNNNSNRQWFIIFLIAGGTGNFLERIFFGCVFDYIAIPYFPVFNGADVLLTIGVLGIFFSSFRRESLFDSAH